MKAQRRELRQLRATRAAAAVAYQAAARRQDFARHAGLAARQRGFSFVPVIVSSFVCSRAHSYLTSFRSREGPNQLWEDENWLRSARHDDMFSRRPASASSIPMPSSPCAASLHRTGSGHSCGIDSGALVPAPPGGADRAAVHRPTHARGRDYGRRPSLPQAAPFNGGALHVVSLGLTAQRSELRASRSEMRDLEHKVQLLLRRCNKKLST